MTLEDLPKGLDGIYRQFLTTRTVGKKALCQTYRKVMGLLSAAQEPLTFDQLVQLTGMGKQEVNDIVQYLMQFLDISSHRKDQYQFYHQSFRDFLGNRDLAQKFWIDMQSVHTGIANYYLEHYAATWQQCDMYGLRHLPHHMSKAGMVDSLKDLLLSFSWMYAKLKWTNVTALMVDYDLYDNDPALSHVQDAIRKSSHILSNDKKQLASHLIGRLFHDPLPRIQELLEQARAWNEDLVLCPLNACLKPPGDPLKYTLEGHTDEVNAADLQKVAIHN